MQPPGGRLGWQLVRVKCLLGDCITIMAMCRGEESSPLYLRLPPVPAPPPAPATRAELGPGAGQLLELLRRQRGGGAEVSILTAVRIYLK